jgi:hypothetical protein
MSALQLPTSPLCRLPVTATSQITIPDTVHLMVFDDTTGVYSRAGPGPRDQSWMEQPSWKGICSVEVSTTPLCCTIVWSYQML